MNYKPILASCLIASNLVFPACAKKPPLKPDLDPRFTQPVPEGYEGFRLSKERAEEQRYNAAYEFIMKDGKYICDEEGYPFLKSIILPPIGLDPDKNPINPRAVFTEPTTIRDAHKKPFRIVYSDEAATALALAVIEEAQKKHGNEKDPEKMKNLDVTEAVKHYLNRTTGISLFPSNLLVPKH